MDIQTLHRGYGSKPHAFPVGQSTFFFFFNDIFLNGIYNKHDLWGLVGS